MPSDPRPMTVEAQAEVLGLLSGALESVQWAQKRVRASSALWAMELDDARHALREAIAGLRAEPPAPTTEEREDLFDSLHAVFTRHGIPSRTKTALFTDVVAWAARACKQSSKPSTTEERPKDLSKQSGVVHSDAECIWNYCPVPWTCTMNPSGCVHKRPKETPDA